MRPRSPAADSDCQSTLFLPRRQERIVAAVGRAARRTSSAHTRARADISVTHPGAVPQGPAGVCATDSRANPETLASTPTKAPVRARNSRLLQRRRFPSSPAGMARGRGRGPARDAGRGYSVTRTPGRQTLNLGLRQCDNDGSQQAPPLECRSHMGGGSPLRARRQCRDGRAPALTPHCSFLAKQEGLRPPAGSPVFPAKAAVRRDRRSSSI